MSKALEVLGHAEEVLMKKLRGLRDGKPKWACADELLEVRHAIGVLKMYDKAVAEAELNEDALIMESLVKNPPLAQA
jgi:hypothetical protein